MYKSSSNENSCIAFIGATLIDGTGKPPLKDSAIIIDGNTIKQVGPRSQVTIPEKATTIELTGKTITPGFIDSHFHHFLSSILSKINFLTDIESLQETLNIVKEKATKLKPGEWVHGYGWDESKWPENRYITTEDLDEVSPDNPVGLIRVDVHNIVFNTEAFRYMEKTGRHIDSEDGQSSLNMMENIFNFIDVTMPDISIDELSEGLGNITPFCSVMAVQAFMIPG